MPHHGTSGEKERASGLSGDREELFSSVVSNVVSSALPSAAIDRTIFGEGNQFKTK